MLPIRLSIVVLCLLAVVIPLYADLTAQIVNIDGSETGPALMVKSDKFSVTFDNVRQNQVQILPAPEKLTIQFDGVVLKGEPLDLGNNKPGELLWNGINMITGQKIVGKITNQIGRFTWRAQKSANSAGAIINGTVSMEFAKAT